MVKNAYIRILNKDNNQELCRYELNREFVDSFCTKRFRNTDYKKHRENVLFEREKVRMPETQPQVERIIKLRDLRHLYYELLNILATKS